MPGSKCGTESSENTQIPVPLIFRSHCLGTGSRREEIIFGSPTLGEAALKSQQAPMEAACLLCHAEAVQADRMQNQTDPSCLPLMLVCLCSFSKPQSQLLAVIGKKWCQGL